MNIYNNTFVIFTVFLASNTFAQTSLPDSLKLDLKNNSFGTRYLLTSNGYGLSLGDISYENHYIFGNVVNFGVTNYFSLGVGLSTYGFIFKGFPNTIMVSPKFSIPLIKEKINLAIGASVVTDIKKFTTREIRAYNLFYNAALTYGSPSNNISIGYIYNNQIIQNANTNYSSKDLPNLITLSGIKRITNQSYLLSENFIGKRKTSSLNYDNLFSTYLGHRIALKHIGYNYGVLFTYKNERSNGFYLVSTNITPYVGLIIPLK